jgi:hypothetical protein
VHSRLQQIQRHGKGQIDHPHQHADHPLFVMNAVVTVARSIITTAPGHNCRFIGAGAIA